MSDYSNAKFRIKFLRKSTLDNTPLNPGNLLVDMDNKKVYIDILTADNTLYRVNFEGHDMDDFYTKSEVDDALESLITQLQNAIDPE